MSHKLSLATKALHGTHRAPRPAAPSAVGTPRIARPVPPPKDLDPDLRRLWRTHMALLVMNGRAAMCDLVAFAQMIECGHATEIAHKAALAEGPTTPGQLGEEKTSSAWRVWLMTQKQYFDWLAQFGLLPRARSGLPWLPAPADAPLRLVERAG
jgi:hypothetical protein